MNSDFVHSLRWTAATFNNTTRRGKPVEEVAKIVKEAVDTAQAAASRGLCIATHTFFVPVLKERESNTMCRRIEVELLKIFPRVAVVFHGNNTSWIARRGTGEAIMSWDYTDEHSAPSEDAKAELLIKPVNEIDWSLRVDNAFFYAGIKTIGDLVSRTPSDLLQLKNFGHGSLQEVESTLADMGLGLRLK